MYLSQPLAALADVGLAGGGLKRAPRVVADRKLGVARSSIGAIANFDTPFRST